jgi:hypothetical protein
MATSDRSRIQLPIIPNLPGEILEDEDWCKQKQYALQVVIACKMYRSDHGKFPSLLTDLIEIMNHDVREQKRMKRFFEFTDPASNKVHAWIYNPNARPESDDIVISSPESSIALRVVCTASGSGAVISEDSYCKLANIKQNSNYIDTTGVTSAPDP